MKKLLALILAGMLVLSACGDSTTDTTETTPVTETESTETTDVEETEETTTEETTAEETQETVEETPEVASDNTIEIGKPMTIGAYEMTIKSFELVEDMSGLPGIKVVYDWTNNSEETIAPFMSYYFQGFQNGVATQDEHIFDSDVVDLGSEQNDARPGATVTDAETVIPLNDANQEVELELKESMTFVDTGTYTVVLDPQNLPQ